MIRFADGPAVGLSLLLTRAPLYLRVVARPKGGDPEQASLGDDWEWDALDQIDDEPDPSETIYVYRRAGKATHLHVDLLEGGRHVGRWQLMATYELLADQPADAEIRDNAAWKEWAQRQYEQTKGVQG